MVNFLYGAPKTCQLFKVSVVLPPSGKISAGAHACASLLTDDSVTNIYALFKTELLHPTQDVSTCNLYVSNVGNSMQQIKVSMCFSEY